MKVFIKNIYESLRAKIFKPPPPQKQIKKKVVRRNAFGFPTEYDE
jgi:hypothetical protein|tara:strand:+ start:185 stop:319 length:135 start_codon:yes stop_codon:yes gene_type:complete